MTREAVRAALVEALCAVVPEARGVHPDAGLPLRDQFDMDSMDFMNFVVGIHERLGVDVPEADYAQVARLDAAEAYLARRLGLPPVEG